MKNLIRKILREETTKGVNTEEFVSFAKDYLDLDNNFIVRVVNGNDDLETMASYDINDNEVVVNQKNRAFPDVIRSIAHEMVHHKQNQDGVLTGNKEEGSDGSPIENEANAMAGEIVRKFGKKYPEIYNL
ncbi:hypothetical protein N9994_00905 [bacterium]|nr:hypothetical protein [bacterium]